ncbi:MAG TPA: sulfite exporter TauE/SafE family protein [Thermoleophilia bacterium]
MTQDDASEAVVEAAGPATAREHRVGFVVVPQRLWPYRWPLVLVAWAGLVALAYASVGGHLNAYLTITGLLVGFLVGLTGMGGGALMTPILILFFGFSPTTAIGTDITYAAVTKIVGSWRHRRLGSVDIPLAVWLAAGSVPAALLGVAAVTYVKSHYGDLINGILYRAIGGALLAVSILLVVKVVMHVDQAHRRENIRMTTRRKFATVCLGFFAGFVIGLTSVGSGTFLAVFLILFYPLTTDRIVGTDVFHAMILLCITGLAQIGVGNVSLWMVAALLMGSIPGVLIGSQLTRLAPSRVLRLCLAVVLFLSGLALLSKA